MSERGLKEVVVFVASCASRSGLPTWEWLEKALLTAFRAEYEGLPKCNDQGRKLKWNRKLDRMFKRKAIEQILGHFDVSRN
jgi:hypothetical protein